MQKNQQPNQPAAHTPGPWTLHPTLGEKLDPPQIYCNGSTVCTVDTSAPEPGERIANARLIAAAPEMLEALHESREALLNVNPSWRDNACANGTPKDKDCPCTIHKIDRAIDKAERRAS